ncbi:TMV resistance protein N-like [Arachis duranensis]|uniref:TMV resistance protein N-like n=1 Tax=Arachis duranensis TaxID=130453 RepID=A0A6P4E0C8_ARADU|nr:TMV resistance protein N-like [Arachis duranensis]
MVTEEGVSSPAPSSTSNNNRRWSYHVFLSFRGADTRKGFTNHLYSALKDAGIIVFRDDKILEVGDVISDELPRAIKDSLSAIVILSPKYATSTWCLEELHCILESKLEVFPIFYDVEASDVRYQKGSFAEAFEKHEKRYDGDKVQKWRDALTQVAGLSGWGSKKRLEAELIEEIVTTVWTRLQPKLPTFRDGLVGIDKKIEDMNSLLRPDVKDVRFIGIWGMGGIGKTTLAKVLYMKIRRKFEISCTLDNVREASGQRHGLLNLQRELLSKLKIMDTKIEDEYQGIDTIRNFLFNKKVLLILDDVSDMSQLENLAEKEWFGPGSRVIVTTRDMQLLTSHGISEKYEIDFLNPEESLQLFSRKAFKRDEPPEHFLKLSKAVIKYAGGLPLTLKLLGSLLCERSVSQWKEVLEQIKEVPESDSLHRTLGISYDGLPRRYKGLFLDIACFFKGWTKDQVKQILNDCGRYPPIGIEILIEKSLVTYDSGVLGMHDSLQDMGRSIVFEESPEIAGKRSRLWSLDDIDHVLRKNKVNESTQGIVLELWHLHHEARWHPEGFSNMEILRLLILSSNLHLPLGLKCLSSGLKVLVWRECPLNALPLGVPLDELVRLEMPHSNLKQLWNGMQYFAKMKSIYLSHSLSLASTPDFTGIPNLEILYLDECINLFEVHPSLGKHRKLVKVSLADCRNLKKLPRKLEMESLKCLDLHGCTNVRKLPEFGENMIHLEELDLHNIAIAELPPSLGHVTALRTLNLESCQNLICLPKTFGNLKSLTKLNICCCSNFSKLPENLNENEALEYLNASLTALREIPSSIVHLKNLMWLIIAGCKVQETSNSWNIIQPIAQIFGFKSYHPPISMSLVLPPSISGMRMLKELSLRNCNLHDGSIPYDLGCLSSLELLDLSKNNFVNLPDGCFSKLFKLAELYIYDCQSLVSLPDLPPNAAHVYLYNCPRLESLPKLPPTVQRVDACQSVSLKPLSDPEQIWSLLEAIDLEEVEDPDSSMKFSRFRPILEIPGTELPACFENDYFVPDKQFLEHFGIQFESAVSIILEIPESCSQSEFWGIAVCLVIEGNTESAPLQYYDGLYCFSQVHSANSEEKQEINIEDAEWIKWIPNYKCPHILMYYYPVNFWQHDENKVKLMFYAINNNGTGNKMMIEGGSSKKCSKIKKCGARLVSKMGAGCVQKTPNPYRKEGFPPTKIPKVTPEGMYVATAYATTRIR